MFAKTARKLTATFVGAATALTLATAIPAQAQVSDDTMRVLGGVAIGIGATKLYNDYKDRKDDDDHRESRWRDHDRDRDRHWDRGRRVGHDRDHDRRHWHRRDRDDD